MEHVSGLTANGRTVLLSYDCYRSHMNVRVLKLLENNGIVVHALSAHTSGKTQPFEVKLFSKFKMKLKDVIADAIVPFTVDKLDVFDFCGMMWQAFDETLTCLTMSKTIRKAGIWPIDPSTLLSTQRHKSAQDTKSILAVDEREAMFMAKRYPARQIMLGTHTSVQRAVLWTQMVR